MKKGEKTRKGAEAFGSRASSAPVPSPDCWFDEYARILVSKTSTQNEFHVDLGQNKFLFGRMSSVSDEGSAALNDPLLFR